MENFKEKDQNSECQCQKNLKKISDCTDLINFFHINRFLTENNSELELWINKILKNSDELSKLNEIQKSDEQNQITAQYFLKQVIKQLHENKNDSILMCDFIQFLISTIFKFRAFFVEIEQKSILFCQKMICFKEKLTDTFDIEKSTLLAEIQAFSSIVKNLRQQIETQNEKSLKINEYSTSSFFIRNFRRKRH